MAEKGKLEGRVAIVTGGSRGIGREIALTLARNGASVVIAYQSNSAKAHEVVSLIEANHGKAIAVKAEVSSEADVKDLFDAAESAYGQIHILVNSAGVVSPTYPKIEDTSVEDWDWTFSVNTKGCFFPCKEGAKRIVRGGGGRIINITSSVVLSLLPGYGAYAASKAAVEAFTKVLSKEMRGRRITANCIAPGAVATDMFFAGKSEEMIKANVNSSPLERLGEPKDISEMVLFAVSDEGEWLNGQAVRLNGGSVE